MEPFEYERVSSTGEALDWKFQRLSVPRRRYLSY